MVDECQDLNACQSSLCKILGQETTQYIFVGDPRQSILGFAGADERSYQAIVSDFDCRELPLSSCFRCPDVAINLVNNIYPSIQSGAGWLNFLEAPKPDSVGKKTITDSSTTDHVWKSGRTRTIQVPEIFADELMAIARNWDNNK